MARPRVIAITGSIGSGKSLVGKLLEEHGYKVIDTDAVVHYLFEDNAELKRSVQERFGSAVVSPSGEIDRSALGTVVFEDAIARRDLERIVHPAVLNECDRMLDMIPSDKPVFILIPLLFEAGLEKRYDEIWSVTTTEPILRARLKQRNSYSDDEISQRLSAQLPQSEKARRSHRVINNSGSIENTTKQVEALLADFK